MLNALAEHVRRLISSTKSYTEDAKSLPKGVLASLASHFQDCSAVVASDGSKPPPAHNLRMGLQEKLWAVSADTEPVREKLSMLTVCHSSAPEPSITTSGRMRLFLLSERRT